MSYVLAKGRSCAAVALLAVAGCASVSKDAGYGDVGAWVDARTGHRTAWDQGTPDDAEVDRRVTAALREPLSLDAAVQVALWNNPELQAIYAGFGVSQADVVQAGLLKNPSFSGSVRFPFVTAPLDVGLSLVQDFLDLFALPLRKSVAASRFVQAQLTLAHETFTFALRARQAFYEVQARQRLVELRRGVAEAAASAAELAQRQREAGNITELDAQTQSAAAQEAGLALSREKLALVRAREHLTRLMGLSGPQARWAVAGSLPALPPAEATLESLESRALTQRLDVLAAQQQGRVYAEAVRMARTLRYVGTLEVGASGGRAPEEPRVLGPTLTLELPLFDQRQALIARLEAQQAEAERHATALFVDAQSQVREAQAAVATQRHIVEQYQKELLPMREHIVSESLRKYNGMLLGVFQLLLAKEAQVSGERDYIEALRDYWVARAELDGAVGGRGAP
jgi:cobalt-zinc-cadmium efflux system outer membrane protein